MSLENQFKVIFYSFIYGMFFVFVFRLFSLIKFKNKVLKVICEFVFCILNLILFYFLLYKINNGVLSFYIFLMLILGGLFCKVFYFGNKKYWKTIKKII